MILVEVSKGVKRVASRLLINKDSMSRAGTTTRNNRDLNAIVKHTYRLSQSNYRAQCSKTTIS